MVVEEAKDIEDDYYDTERDNVNVISKEQQQ